MKITPDIFRQIAEHLKIASEASAKISQILSALAVEPPQTELPLTGNSGSTTILIHPAEVQAIAKKLVEEVNPPIEHSAEYLASKRACVEVAPEAPAPKEEPKPEPITRQSLRALAEKLVAKGRLPDVKAALAKHGVTTLSALKPENYAAVQADFIKNGAL